MLIVITSLLWLERKRLEAEVASTRESPGLTETDHDNYQRQIRNLESTIRRLREHETTRDIQISARDTQIEQLQAKLDELKACPYELIHRIADHQAKNIRDFVTVSRVGVWGQKLNDPVPTIQWGFTIQNQSIFAISLVEVRNNVVFEKTELAERRFEVQNEVEQLGYWRHGTVIFDQRLSGPEAQYIRTTPDGKFRFNRLKITVGNPNTFPIIEPQEIVIGDDLETTLDTITHKETEGMKRLKDEIDLLKQQKEARTPNPGLKFEIDEKNTHVGYRGFSGGNTLVAAMVRLRCSKIGDSKLGVREFLAELRTESGDVTVQDGRLIRAYVDNHTKDTVDLEAGWTIDQPLTDFRVYDFMFEIDEAIHTISRDVFFRVIRAPAMNSEVSLKSHNSVAVKSKSSVRLSLLKKLPVSLLETINAVFIYTPRREVTKCRCVKLFSRFSRRKSRSP